ncbi:MAG: IS21 family transposase [Actinomycetota bacterium]|nr:IS21 family transposase [Actinomycetota bacterium]
MKTVADYQFIRKLHVDHGMSIREIAREYHYSRRTIRAALGWDGSDSVGKYERQKAPARPKTGEYVGTIDEWLVADQKVHRKQRHTAKRIWERLRDEYGVDVAECTVRRLVAQRRAEIAPLAKQVYLMLAFEAGDLAQVDWGEARVWIDGVLTKMYLFCMRLGYSTAPFVMAFSSMRMECFLEGHARALEYFAGVPRHLVYDNLSSAVKKILRGRERELNPRFQQLAAYYLFEPEFANPAAGWEKGLVEGLVGFSRRNYLVPVPRVSSLAELNAQLRAKTLALRAQTAAERGDRTVGDLWDEEIGRFLPLPRTAFRASTTHAVRVDKFSVFRHQQVKYSVPSRYAERRLRLEAFHDRLEVYDGANLVASHAIVPIAKSPVLRLEHYLDVLVRKPGAVRHAQVVSQLGSVATAYRDAFLKAQPQAYSEFVRVLLLVRTYPWPLVLSAMALATERRVYSAAGVDQIVRECQGNAVASAATLPHGPRVHQPDPARFDELVVASR